MNQYVLDTHALLFLLVSPSKLGKAAAQALRKVQRGQALGLVPAAVVAELVMLRELRRTTVGMPELRSTFADNPGLRFSPLDLPQLERFAVLGVLRDPFDRLIVSAALASGSRLVSRDGMLAESGLVEVVW